MDLSQYYLDIFNSSKEVLTKSLEKSEDLGKVHTYVDDILIWHKLLKDKAESIIILGYAASAIQVAAFSLVIGLYRQAFVSLRLALELSLSSIVFSTNAFEYKEWERGERDITWSKIVDKSSQDSTALVSNDGVFSHRYTKNFFPELNSEAKHYNSLALKTYRKLSEFVHGNAETWNENHTLDYKDEAFQTWIDLFTDVSSIITFALCLRFLRQLNSQEVQEIEAQVIETLGHIPEIRSFLGSAAL